ncbi:MAG: alpha/beta hydrolase [Eggerthellaceae bacterium]|nr:alpha/beta hydrolase [Eggerthellaceae bacterium]
MSTRYPIDPELRFLSGFNAPLGAALTRAAQPLLRALPKNLDPRHLTLRRVDLPREGAAPPLRLLALSPRDAGETEALPWVLYLHGGAFMHAAVPTQYRLAGEYAVGARCRILIPDYRLTPTYPYPAGLNDCLRALRHAREHGADLGIRPDRLIIAGDSAGGSLALDTFLAARGENPAFAPLGLMLVYPVVDPRQVTASMQDFDDTPIWNARKNALMWQRYLRGTAGKAYVSPLARTEEFAGLANLYVEVEEFDCLHDEGALLYEALSPRVPHAVLRDNPGTYHGFEFHHRAAITRASVESRVAFLREAFAGF